MSDRIIRTLTTLQIIQVSCRAAYFNETAGWKFTRKVYRPIVIIRGQPITNKTLCGPFGKGSYMTERPIQPAFKRPGHYEIIFGSNIFELDLSV